MKIAIAQMNIKSGKCEENFQTLAQEVKKAKQDHADIIVFPEMCISGYLLQDYFLDHEFCLYVHSFNERIKTLSNDIGIIFGNLYYDEILGIKKGRDGRLPRYNMSLFAYQNEWVKKENNLLNGFHIKHLNPDYRMFDDSRYFLSGMEVAHYVEMKSEEFLSPFIFERNDQIYRIGLQVCEDLWSFDYSVDVTSIYIKQNVDYIINSSSSPYTPNKESARHKTIIRHAKLANNQLPIIVYCNASGMQNSGKNVVMFDGDSCVYGSDGRLVASMRDDFVDDYIVYDANPDLLSLNLREPIASKQLIALTQSIYEFDKQIFPFKPNWIIGLSGGIDSTVNAALLVKALGSERVIAYNLASQYNSSTTINNAKDIADALNIRLYNGSIESLNDATIDTMKAYGYEAEYNSLAYENIQARLRGHLLSTFASIENGIIVNNGNKVEIALGYCTLYGDTIGAISPLGDLSKVQVFELAKSLNEVFGKNVVPLSLIPEVKDNEISWGMPPSAELKDAQVDPMKWYYHDYLIQMILDYPTGQVENFMESYLDKSIYETEIGDWIRYYHLDDATAFINDLEWVLSKLHQSVFKRIQMPPIVIMSRGAFGSDYRESQVGFVKTARYEQLKAKILRNDA